jgi:hypothetical protein
VTFWLLDNANERDGLLSAFVIKKLFPRNDNFADAEYRDYRALLLVFLISPIVTILVVAPVLHKVLFEVYNFISGLQVMP